MKPLSRTQVLQVFSICFTLSFGGGLEVSKKATTMFVCFCTAEQVLMVATVEEMEEAWIEEMSSEFHQESLSL